jgi:hypothetical protein
VRYDKEEGVDAVAGEELDRASNANAKRTWTGRILILQTHFAA